MFNDWTLQINQFQRNDFINVLFLCLNELNKKFETQIYQDGFKIIRPIDDR